MQVMLWLLTEHHLLPGRYKALAEGEKELLRCFYIYTMTQRKEAAHGR